jgi:hypothetical protein
VQAREEAEAMRFKVDPLAGQDAFGAVVTALSPDAIGDPVTRQALYDAA